MSGVRRRRAGARPRRRRCRCRVPPAATTPAPRPPAATTTDAAPAEPARHRRRRSHRHAAATAGSGAGDEAARPRRSPGPRRVRLSPPRGSGGTGRRTSLRGWRSQERGGSNPPFRTSQKKARYPGLFRSCPGIANEQLTTARNGFSTRTLVEVRDIAAIIAIAHSCSGISTLLPIDGEARLSRVQSGFAKFRAPIVMVAPEANIVPGANIAGRKQASVDFDFHVCPRSARASFLMVNARPLNRTSASTTTMDGVFACGGGRLGWAVCALLSASY